MKIVAIIPARYLSTRLQTKVLLDIAGKPMIGHVYERARQASLVQDVFVATDDQRIARIVTDFGGKPIMTSTSHNSGMDRVAEAVINRDIDIVVNVQGDEPLIRPEMIDQAIAVLLEDNNILMSTLKCSIDNDVDVVDPNIVKVITDKNDFALYFSRLPLPYDRDNWKTVFHTTALHYKHIGLYVYRKDFLLNLTQLPPSPLEKIERLEQLRVLENGYKIKVLTTKYDSYSVDTEGDLKKVRKLMMKSE
ncbi:MAG: 3-deoxy-manno-octulosonate cytidylyltransferase [bacterium]